MAISFKSVGESINDVEKQRAIRRDANQFPLGIITPVRQGDESDGIFKMHYDLKGLIRDNLKNLLLTNHGDRVGRYDFGANLLPLTLNITSKDDFDSEAMSRIKIAVERYMPFIELVEFESLITQFPEQDDVGKIAMTVTYNVPAAGIERDAITLVFYVGG